MKSIAICEPKRPLLHGRRPWAVASVTLAFLVGCGAAGPSELDELEPLDQLRRRVDEASRHTALDRLGVSPQCGFASSVGGNPLSLDDQRRKLARVVELADAVWG